jgi:protein required for attachment to host cells
MESEMSSSSTWILVADEARARLFETHSPGDALNEVACFANPDRAEAGLAEVSGSPIAHERAGSRRRTNLHRKHAERFSRRLKDALERGRIDHRYARLVLIAPPLFLGALHVSLSKPLRDSVVAEVKRNLTALPARDIRSHLPRRLLGSAGGRG